MEKCVSTALARADRSSDPPEKLTKTLKKRSANQHTYKPNFHTKSTSKDNPFLFCVKSHQCFTAPAQSPQTPQFKKLTLSNCNSNHSGSALRHPVPDYHVPFMLLPWSPMVSPSWQNDPQGKKMKAPSLPIDRFWTPTIAISVSKVTAISGKTIKTNLQKPTCFRIFHRKTKTLKTTNNQ